MWNPHGPLGLHVEFTWSTWTPPGFHVESAWTPHRPHTQVWVGFLQKKVHADSMWTPQLHVESGRNLWGRVKSSLKVVE